MLFEARQTFTNITSSINKKHVYYFTNPFREAYTLAEKKLHASNLWKEVEEGAYCYLINKNEACVFNIRINRDLEEIHCDYFYFVEDDILLSFGTCMFIYDEVISLKLGPFNGYISESSTPKATPETMSNLVGTWILITLFIKYADVQTKELPAKKKTEEINCKYINETDSLVTILDSTWFTNLIKSDAFKVRGHFRLQPKKKEGEWTKELIWINEFQKEGYTRKAGILHEA
jgi:hypothetical protein